MGASSAGEVDTGPYRVKRSARFNDDDSSYLSWTPSSAGNRKTWTWSGWVKRGNITGTSASQGLFSQDSNCFFRFSDDNGGDSFRFVDSSNVDANLISERLFRDPSAWYHVVVAVDSTQGTDSNRIKVYINNEQITDWQTSVWPGLNHDFDINAASEHQIARCQTSTYFDGLMTDIHFIDGQQLTPGDFAEADETTGQWVPKRYTGSYGTNGFHLVMDPAESNPFGDDSSGNGNDWTANNMVADVGGTSFWSGNLSLSAGTWGGGQGPGKAFNGVAGASTNMAQRGDAAGGTITWTFSGLSGSCRVWIGNDGGTVTDGNGTTRGNNVDNGGTWVTLSGDISDYNGSIVISVSSDAPSLGAVEVGGVILRDPQDLDLLADVPGVPYDNDLNGGGNYPTMNPLMIHGLHLSNGNLTVINPETNSWENARSTMAVQPGEKCYCEVNIIAAESSGSNAVVELGVTTDIPMDAPEDYLGQEDTSWIWQNNGGTALGHNNSWSNYGGTTPTYETGDVIGIAVDLNAGTLKYYKNGADQGTAFTSLPTDTPVTFACALYNDSEVAWNFGQRSFAYSIPTNFNSLNTYTLTDPTITDPSTGFDVKLWTGDGSSQDVSYGFDPDLFWAKRRSTGSDSHHLYDRVRGDDIYLQCDGNGTEGTDADSCEFGTNKVTIGDNRLNPDTISFVGWAWDAGSSAAADNTDGNITTSVKVDNSKGFSIVSYTGEGTSGDEIGHGLNAAPQFVIIKNRDNNNSWAVMHTGNGLVGENINGTSVPEQFMMYLDYNNLRSNWTGDVIAPNGSSKLTLGSGAMVNTDDEKYIAYCWSEVAGYSRFASWKCLLGNDFIYTGFKPKFLIGKSSTKNGSWVMYDTERDPFNRDDDNNTLIAELDVGEDGSFHTYQTSVDLLSNGFKIRHATSAPLADSNETYIFCAWAEHPFKYANAR